MKYSEFVNAKASTEFHTEAIRPAHLFLLMGLASNLSVVADDIKRGLFYGKRKEADAKVTEESLKKVLQTEGVADEVVWFVDIPQSYAGHVHAALGLLTEACELIEPLLLMIRQDAPSPDRLNLIEEAGDIRWYYQLLLNTLAVSDNEVITVNVAKLNKRNPAQQFNVDNTVNRDLDAERKAMVDSMLVGSSTFAAMIPVGSIMVQLGELVARTQLKSSMTITAWNSLHDHRRDELLQEELDAWRKSVAASSA
jgi:NTP pyrophosphatase (non-canonical NTP hydrolase)